MNISPAAIQFEAPVDESDQYGRIPEQEARWIMREEWHITINHHGVENPMLRWSVDCFEIGIKPLCIELPTFQRQFMCAAKTDVSREIKEHGWEIFRVKHEVEARALEKVQYALYYEAHLKLDGPFSHAMAGASRDLYRSDRWYVTRRSRHPFNPIAFRDQVMARLVRGENGSILAGHEYEACLADSNRALDYGWLR